MNADKEMLYSLTERVLGAVCEGTNTLGAGFLKKVYQRAHRAVSQLSANLPQPYPRRTRISSWSSIALRSDLMPRRSRPKIPM